MHAPRALVRAVLAWPVETQQGSRRNAMVASTLLAQRRRELDEVEAFLAARTGQAPVRHRSDGSHREVI